MKLLALPCDRKLGGRKPLEVLGSSARAGRRRAMKALPMFAKPAPASNAWRMECGNGYALYPSRVEILDFRSEQVVCSPFVDPESPEQVGLGNYCACDGDSFCASCVAAHDAEGWKP